MITIRTAAIATAGLILTGCGGNETTTPPAAHDPYEVYQDIAPDGALELSREDAQTRAFLGCGYDFAPGTVDAALAEAYKDLCDSLP